VRRRSTAIALFFIRICQSLRSNICRSIFAVIFFLIPNFSFGQTNWVDRYFAEVRANKNPITPPEVFKIDNIKTGMDLLPAYLRDSSAQVRRFAITLAQIIGVESRWEPTRHQITRWLIQSATDVDNSNVGICLSYLTTFTKKDFLKSHRDSISKLLNPKQSHRREAMKLMGFLGMIEVSAELLQIANDVSLEESERWAAFIALARLGNSDAIIFVNNRSRKILLNDDLISELFPDLIYTRQPAIINYVIEILQSDERNCESADNDDDKPIPCGYRIMEQLATVIKNYPLAVDATGDIKIRDYPKALEKVRIWFKERGTDYELDREKY
jgi:hypothetical protein